MLKPNCVDHNKLWKILKEMGIPDLLTCLLRNLYAGYKAVRQLEQAWNRLIQNWERRMTRLCIITLLINLYAEYIMKSHRLDESQTGIKTARRNIKNFNMQMISI